MMWEMFAIPIGSTLVTLLAVGLAFWKYIFPRLIQRIEAIEKKQEKHRDPESKPHPVYVTWESKKELEDHLEMMCRQNREDCNKVICSKIDGMRVYHERTLGQISEKLSKMEEEDTSFRRDLVVVQTDLVKVMTLVRTHLERTADPVKLAKEIAKELKNGGEK